MITKAEIQSIDLVGNTCIVRMPFFETLNVGDKAIAEAIFSITPGVYNSYKVGDVVLVAFEDNQLSKPTVIGKLYISSTDSYNDPRGAINCSDLTVCNNCKIPLNTELVSIANGIEVTGSATTYKTIGAIADRLKQLDGYIDSHSSSGTQLYKHTLSGSITTYDGDLYFLGAIVSNIATVENISDFENLLRNIISSSIIVSNSSKELVLTTYLPSDYLFIGFNNATKASDYIMGAPISSIELLNDVVSPV